MTNESEKECNQIGDRCWYCGGKLRWNSDFNYDEVYGEGEGIVTYLTCTNPNCRAEVEYSIREDDEEETGAETDDGGSELD